MAICSALINKNGERANVKEYSFTVQTVTYCSPQSQSTYLSVVPSCLIINGFGKVLGMETCQPRHDSPAYSIAGISLACASMSGLVEIQPMKPTTITGTKNLQF